LPDSPCFGKCAKGCERISKSERVANHVAPLRDKLNFPAVFVIVPFLLVSSSAGKNNYASIAVFGEDTCSEQFELPAGLLRRFAKKSLRVLSPTTLKRAQLPLAAAASIPRASNQGIPKFPPQKLAELSLSSSLRRREKIYGKQGGADIFFTTHIGSPARGRRHPTRTRYGGRKGGAKIYESRV